jgi:hypothetical protein
MSAAARIMQILFIIGGLLSFGLGLLSSVLTGSPETKTEWTCSTSVQSQTERCSGSVNSGLAQVPMLLVFSGIGLEIAAAAISIGGRRATPAPAPVFPAHAAGPAAGPQGGGWPA